MESKAIMRILQILYILFMAGYGIYQMVIGIIAYNSFSQTAQLFNAMVDNFEADPVIDLVFRESVCNNGEDPVFGYTWPGTYSGCDCRYATR